MKKIDVGDRVMYFYSFPCRYLREYEDYMSPDMLSGHMFIVTEKLTGYLLHIEPECPSLKEIGGTLVDISNLVLIRKGHVRPILRLPNKR